MAEELSKRRVARRVPISTRNILTIKGQEPGYHYRIVNDEPGRIEDLSERGYEIVTDKSVTIGDKRVSNPTQEGSPKKVHVGGGKYAFVMRIKDEFYKEDQDAKQRQVDEIEQQIKREAKSVADYGELRLK
jgi:hypothetical protein